MVFTEQDVKQLLQEALQQAQSEPDTGETTPKINFNRSTRGINKNPGKL